jgi:hypothetical protein
VTVTAYEFNKPSVIHFVQYIIHGIENSAKSGFEVDWDDEHLWNQISISSNVPSETNLLFHLTKYHHVTRMAPLHDMKVGKVSSKLARKQHQAAALGWITQVNRLI